MLKHQSNSWGYLWVCWTRQRGIINFIERWLLHPELRPVTPRHSTQTDLKKREKNIKKKKKRKIKNAQNLIKSQKILKFWRRKKYMPKKENIKATLLQGNIGNTILGNIHVTGDTWHITPDTWHMTLCVGWTFSQNFSSLALPVLNWQCLEDIWTKGSLY